MEETGAMLAKPLILRRTAAYRNLCQARASMAAIEIYTTPFCPFCFRAKRLLRRKGLTFTEIDVFADGKRREEMLERADGRHTVPQIFIGGEGIGGSDDLHALESRGELDRMLAAGAGT